MGSAKRLRKLYEKPMKLWDAQRISEERKLLSDYGLKNMHELWRIKTILRKMRREARSLLASRGAGTETRMNQLLERVKRLLVNKPTITLDDVLSLSTREILERRLETLVQRKGFAKTMAQARQFVSHGHIAINGQKNTSPSRLVLFSEERQMGWYGEPITAVEEEIPEPAPAPAVEAKPSVEANPEAKTEAKPHAKHEVRETTQAPPDEQKNSPDANPEAAQAQQI